MALCMDYHKAYNGVQQDQEQAHYPGDGGEPGPPPTMQELMERALQGHVDSDAQVSYDGCLLFVHRTRRG